MMVGFTYTIRLLEPVLANSQAGDSNSARSLPYAPGGLVRGAVIGRYLQDKGKRTGDATDPEFRRLFLSGETRYLHAYPVWEAEKRALPTPLAWKRDKYAPEDRAELYNLAAIADAELPDSDDVTLKGANFPFWQQREDTAVSQALQWQVNVHTQRDAVLGRANVGRGAVYRYEAIPAGVQMQGVVLTANKTDAYYLKSLLENAEFLLGKARAAGYGRVWVTAVADLPDDAWREGWSWQEEDGDVFEELPQTERPSAVTEFTITFLSAGLVRDNCGQFTTDPARALSAHLGISTDALHAERLFRKGEVAGGFNRHWGLPLPQAVAIAPGSMFQYRVDTAVSGTALDKLEETGLGERRAEGFGRVVVEYEMENERISWRQDKPADRSPGTSDDSLDGPAKEMAKRLLQRLLRQDLDEKLLTAVRNLSIDRSISNSQLSRWRMQARNAMMNAETPAAKLEHMTTFYTNEKQKQSRVWQKMRRARVGGVRLTQWLDDILTGENQPWTTLYDKQPPPSLAVGDVTITVDDDLTIEYKLRLIDLILAARMKQNKPGQGGQNG